MCGCSANPIVVDEQPKSVQLLLKQHAQRVLNLSSEYSISIPRGNKDDFWMVLVAFYKNAKVKVDHMKKTLMVRFTDVGEMGADAGALRKEFFEDAIKEVNCRLFEGEDDNRLPKKEWSLQFLFEVSL